MRIKNLGVSSVISSVLSGLLAFAALWYFYFSSSFVLRPFQYVFWAGMAGLSLLLWILANKPILKVDMWFFGGMIVIWLLSCFGTDALGSLTTMMNYLIYYLVAKMITNQNSSRTVINMILFFSLLHLVCIFVQVFAPDIYNATLLPLLPTAEHTEITEQMEYNEVYYGLTIQTSMIAMYLSIGAILSAVKISCETKKGTKLVFFVLLAIFMVGLLFTVRRGSVVAVVAILALMFLLSSGKAWTKAVAVIAVLFVLAWIGFENVPGLEGLLDKFERQADKGMVLSGRENTFARALERFLDRPLFGFGIGHIEEALGYAWLENSYLVILVECGLVGAILFFAPHAVMVKTIVVNYIKRGRRNIGMCFAFYIQLLFLLMSMVENYLASPATVFLFFVVTFAGQKAVEEENKAIQRG